MISTHTSEYPGNNHNIKLLFIRFSARIKFMFEFINVNEMEIICLVIIILKSALHSTEFRFKQYVNENTIITTNCLDDNGLFFVG